VVSGRSRLMLAATCDSHGAHHAGAACLLVDAAVIAGRGCGLLLVLLVPLFATLGTLPDVLDGDIDRRFPAAAWGQVKLGYLVVDGALGGDAAQLLGGTLDSVGRCLNGP
jgi:hypothetical protein